MLQPRKPRHQVVQPTDPAIRLIPLTNGHTATVDAADFEWLSQSNWIAKKSTSTGRFYAAREFGGKTIFMHAVVRGALPGEKTDHADGDTLNNRRSNLRKATAGENQRNQGLSRRNTSGFKGVSYKDGKWQVGIRSEGKQIHIGVYSAPEQAARAYDEAAKKYHGEFAWLNFPPDKKQHRDQQDR